MDGGELISFGHHQGQPIGQRCSSRDFSGKGQMGPEDLTQGQEQNNTKYFMGHSEIPYILWGF